MKTNSVEIEKGSGAASGTSASFSSSEKFIDTIFSSELSFLAKDATRTAIDRCTEFMLHLIWDKVDEEMKEAAINPWDQ